MKKLTVIFLMLVAISVTAQTQYDYMLWNAEQQQFYRDIDNKAFQDRLLYSIENFDYSKYPDPGYNYNSPATVYIPADHSSCYSFQEVTEFVQEIAVEHVQTENAYKDTISSLLNEIKFIKHYLKLHPETKNEMREEWEAWDNK